MATYSGPSEAPRGSPPQLFTDYNKTEDYARVPPPVSPKTDAADWSSARYLSGASTNTKSVPLSSSGGNKIDKLAYLKCNEQIRGGADYSKNEEAPQYEPLYQKPYGEGLGLQHEYAMKQTHQQASPSRKIPRMSEPNFPTSEDYPGISPGIGTTPSPSNNSPTRDHRIDSRYGQQAYYEDGFKKQKDVTTYGTMGSFKAGLRRSEFRASDFIKGKELGNGKFGTVEVVK